VKIFLCLRGLVVSIRSAKGTRDYSTNDYLRGLKENDPGCTHQMIDEYVRATEQAIAALGNRTIGSTIYKDERDADLIFIPIYHLHRLISMWRKAKSSAPLSYRARAVPCFFGEGESYQERVRERAPTL